MPEYPPSFLTLTPHAAYRMPHTACRTSGRSPAVCSLNSQTSEVTMSDRARMIEEALRQHLEAVHVEIVDDSAAHADHLGAQGGGGHFRVVVVSPRFEGLTKVAAQRLVYGALGDLMTTEIHAVQMQTFTPAVWEAVRRET